MKANTALCRCFLLLFISLTPFAARAQFVTTPDTAFKQVPPEQQFAPVGATWYYEQGDPWNYLYRGFYKIESIKDTVVNGKDCRVLYKANEPLCYYPPKRIVVYEEDSVTYFYNDSLDNFQVLYNLKTKKDSTWSTIFFTYLNELDTMVVRVDSVYWQSINGHQLKTLNVRFFLEGNNVGWSTVVERIGDVNYLFNLYIICFDGDFSSGLRCYQDSVIGNYDTGTAPSCDYISVGIEEIGPASFSLYPNPATSTVTISIDEKLTGSTLTIHDITGKQLMETTLTVPQQQLNIESLTGGVYFVTLTSKEGDCVVRKLMK